MSIIYPYFLNETLTVHSNIKKNIPYPFYDSACKRYEALRAVLTECGDPQDVLTKFGLTDYEYRKSLYAFNSCGVAGLIGLNSRQLTEVIDVDVERKIYVFKKARRWFPATKMSILLKGFNHNIDVATIRHLYASYGWAHVTKPFGEVDFEALNLKVTNLCHLQDQTIERESFFCPEDKLQVLLEVFRTLESRGITKRFPGSRVSYEQYKRFFLSFGLLGLVNKARPAFRNSKLGFKEEGIMIFSKIQKIEKNEKYYVKILKSKNINIDPSCMSKIFKKWNVKEFTTHFQGNLERLLEKDEEASSEIPSGVSTVKVPAVSPTGLDLGFISFLKTLQEQAAPISNPGLFLFLPYLNRLKLFEKVSLLMNAETDNGYNWFTLLILNIGRILAGINSISKSCKINEMSLPLIAGLVNMPCNDTILNGLSNITEDQLLEFRQYLTRVTKEENLIEGKRIAFDFCMRDFTGDDAKLKNIGKGPSPKRKICFPGFRPHLAWDVSTGAPIAIEFRNGKARATTTLKRYIKELIENSLGNQNIEHIYIDSEYTAEHIWKFITDKKHGLGAELTMCVKRNPKVKKYIKTFRETNPDWLYYDEEHTYTKQTFNIPVGNSNLQCVLKRKEANGKLRCFGSTLKGLDAEGILNEYSHRWTIENGIKDLTENYFLDSPPGIDPHRINIHYLTVHISRILYEMLCHDFKPLINPDQTKKTLGTIRSEFLTASNATIERNGNELIIKWMDMYPEKIHKEIKHLFEQLNKKENQAIPFLGGLKIKFEITNPRPKNFRNKLKRQFVKF